MPDFRIAAEFLQPPATDVFTALDYEPACMPRVLAARALGFYTPIGAIKAGYGDQLPPMCGECPQERFHASTALRLLYGGAMGGGKTKALLMEGIRDAVRYPGIRIGAFRRTFDELSESFLAELEKIDYAAAVGGDWRASSRELRVRGSVIRFRYVETVEDATRRQGGEYQELLIDDAGLILPEAIGALEERQRTSNPRIPVLGIKLSSNPGGIAHSSLKQEYIEPTEYGIKVIQDAQGRTTQFIPAKATDNPYLDDGYHAQLASIKDPHRRKAMMDGDWSAFVGQVFEEWNHSRHVVPRPRSEFPPYGWRRWSGIDWGHREPWACLWAAQDADRRLWLYREEYEAGLLVSQQVGRIKGREAETEEVTHIIDPSTDNHITDGLSIFEQYAVEGIGCLKGYNDRIMGWAEVHKVLADGPLCVYHRAQKEKGLWQDETCPMLHVVEGTCPNFERTLPMLPYDKTRIEDVDTHAEDHAPDAFRYLVMATQGYVRFMD